MLIARRYRGALHGARVPLSLSLLLACAAGPEPLDCPPGSPPEADGLCHLDEGDTGTATGGGALEAGGATAPTWTGEEALATLEAALEAGFPHTAGIADAYEEFLGHREPMCPSMEDPMATGPTGVWQTDGCTTAEGWSYSGLAMYFGGCIDPEHNKEDPGTRMHEVGMLAQFELTDPAALRFVGGGSATHSSRYYEDGSGKIQDQLGGTFHYEGAAGWLGQGIEASLWATHTWGGAEGRVTTLIGGVGYPGFDLSFDDVRLDWEACAGQPTGTLRLRDPTGYWHELAYDEDCSGCGQLTWRDLDEGRHCVDLAGVLQPLVEAWESPCTQ